MIIKRGRYVRFIYKAFEYVYECMSSGLYFNLNVQPMWDDFYGPHRLAHNPIHNDDIIYTPSVTVFKSDTANPALLTEEEWYDVDVITCAAPNLRENPSNGYNQGDSSARVIKLHEKTKCS